MRWMIIQTSSMRMDANYDLFGFSTLVKDNLDLPLSSSVFSEKKIKDYLMNEKAS